MSTIVDLASVSRTTFYQHFANKQECFLQTQDLIVDFGLRQVTTAYRAEGDWRERLRAGFRAFIDVIASDPAAARLVSVESFSAGTEAVRRHDDASEAFERLFRQSFDQARDEGRVSDVTIRAIVGGIRRVVYLHLREGTAHELPGHVDALLDWALSYQEPGLDVPRKPARRTTASSPPPAAVAPPPLDRRARRLLGHRQRIVDAVGVLVAERGYTSLTVPDISTSAGISNQTFYAHFKGKRDALLAAFDDAAADALRVTNAAYGAETAWPRAVRTGIQALLDHIATRPTFAGLAMVELPSAGVEAQRHADLAIDAFASFLQPRGDQRSSAAMPTVPTVIAQAISGGIWNVLHYEYMHDCGRRLPAFAASLTFVVLAPFLGAAAAAAAARR